MPISLPAHGLHCSRRHPIKIPFVACVSPLCPCLCNAPCHHSPISANEVKSGICIFFYLSVAFSFLQTHTYIHTPPLQFFMLLYSTVLLGQTALALFALSHCLLVGRAHTPSHTHIHTQRARARERDTQGQKSVKTNSIFEIEMGGWTAFA